MTRSSTLATDILPRLVQEEDPTLMKESLVLRFVQRMLDQSKLLREIQVVIVPRAQVTTELPDGSGDTVTFDLDIIQITVDLADAGIQSTTSTEEIIDRLADTVYDGLEYVIVYGCKSDPPDDLAKNSPLGAVDGVLLQTKRDFPDGTEWVYPVVAFLNRMALVPGDENGTDVVLGVALDVRLVKRAGPSQPKVLN